MNAEPLQEEKIVAKLTAAKRNALPGKSFIFPGKRSYPIPDASHARNALARSSGKPQEATVRAAVHKKFPDIGTPGNHRMGAGDGHHAMHHAEHDGAGHHSSTHHAPVHVNVHMNFGGKGKKKFSL